MMKPDHFDKFGASIKTANRLRTTLKSAPLMQSVRFHGPGDIRLDQVEEPVCGKGQVKMKPAYAYRVWWRHVTKDRSISHTVLSNPDKISLEVAALIEPLAVSWHAVDISPFKPGDSVLIVGGGPIGIGIVQVLKLQGAKRIMVAELMENRKRLCGEYGATNILDPREVEIASRVRELTGGVGADMIFDAAGVDKALLDAIPACRTQGTIVNVAVWKKNPTIPVNQVMHNRMRYMGAALYDEMSFLDVIRAISHGHLRPENMITATIPLDQVVAGGGAGFKALLEYRDQHCKILVDVQA
ncbi:uncharacterized protein N7483_011801 [Penicillium malachiteum]|uniref:uncharacterized protein n=1 Tax=Penicillium malachiteum TaxID=1324776 RepID=UPI002549AC17|nr:uncharacterized protein N7483_011801 [Penicillium malachiteum]KAJ5714620.1 hypothetical protein N7483_011801 [Penicillium malachiteum]